MRFAYGSIDDLRRVTDLTDDDVAGSDFGTNTTDEFFDDLFRLTNFRTDPQLSEILVTQSLETMAWLRTKGVRFVLNYGRQSALSERQAQVLRPHADRGVGRRRGAGAVPRQGGAAWRVSRSTTPHVPRASCTTASAWRVCRPVSAAAR